MTKWFKLFAIYVLLPYEKYAKHLANSLKSADGCICNMSLCVLKRTRDHLIGAAAGFRATKKTHWY